MKKTKIKTDNLLLRMELKAFLCNLITTRQRSSREGNVFTCVRLFTGRVWCHFLPSPMFLLEVGVWSRGYNIPPSRYWHPVVTTEVGGMHPTGIHSCFIINSHLLVFFQHGRRSSGRRCRLTARTCWRRCTRGPRRSTPGRRRTSGRSGASGPESGPNTPEYTSKYLPEHRAISNKARESLMLPH